MSADVADNYQDDEYDFDSSDDEDLRNTVGNIPMHWYGKYKHIGYTTHGKKILKPDGTTDGLDDYLAKREDPNYWRTVMDPLTGQKVVLDSSDLDLVKNLTSGKLPDSTLNPYEEYSDWFTSDKMVTPLTGKPPDKRSFVPSKWERLKVGRMVHAIKMGWMKKRQPERKRRLGIDDPEEDSDSRFYDIWGQTDNDSDIMRRHRPYIRPPKRPVPSHYESYNPPEEFLFDDDEKRQWEEQEDYERKVSFIPQKYPCLRRVPAYDNYVPELYDRCQDLHLAARVVRQRVSMNPEDLLPKLPRPADLRPFPHLRALRYKASQSAITGCSTDPSGQWLAISDTNGYIKIFELMTGYCVFQQQFSLNGATVVAVSWNPNPSYPCILFGAASKVHVILTDRCDKLALKKFTTTWNELTDAVDSSWNIESSDNNYQIASISLSAEVRHLAWHSQGDYFLSVTRATDKNALLIHRLSSRKTQAPFSKIKSSIQSAQFDPVKSLLYVAEDFKVDVYNLTKQSKEKTLRPNTNQISCMVVHPTGSHLYIGSFDNRLVWFDLDLGTTPYKLLKIHSGGVRCVSIHPSLPLAASVSDDGSALVLHARVFADLTENPLLVPVKSLRGHEKVSDSAQMVTSCDFHPRLSWLSTTGVDGYVHLYS